MFGDHGSAKNRQFVFYNAIFSIISIQMRYFFYNLVNLIFGDRGPETNAHFPTLPFLHSFHPNVGGGRVVRRCCVSYITGASN